MLLIAPWSKWVIYTLGAFIGLNAVPAYWNSRNLYLSLTPLTAEEMDINYLFTLVAKCKYFPETHPIAEHFF
jgi:hypothetical protein